MAEIAQKPRDTKRKREWTEYDAIAGAIDSVKKLGFGEVNIKITNAEVTYIETTTGIKVK